MSVFGDLRLELVEAFKAAMPADAKARVTTYPRAGVSASVGAAIWVGDPSLLGSDDRVVAEFGITLIASGTPDAAAAQLDELLDTAVDALLRLSGWSVGRSQPSSLIVGTGDSSRTYPTYVLTALKTISRRTFCPPPAPEAAQIPAPIPA